MIAAMNYLFFSPRRTWCLVGFGVLFFTLLLVLLTVTTSTLYAQSETQNETPDDAVAAVDTSAVSADEVNVIARELWCPLCSGVRLDSCELKACEQMKDVIAIKLSEGEDLDAIRTYFVAQYGPQVLGEPPLEGFNWLAWILPFVVLAIGGYVLWMAIKRMARPVGAPVPMQMSGNHPGGRTDGSDHSNQNGEVIPNEYEAKLAEELKRYG